MHFRVTAKGEDQGEFILRMPGVHNVRNALATIALCDEQQVHIEATRKALADFEGVQRRFSERGQVNGITVIDDYGHHPTELTATLAAARNAYPDQRIVASFQPHRYTRVRDHLEAFAASLDPADVVVLTDVYPAGEKPIPGADTEALLGLIRERSPSGRLIVHEPSVDDLCDTLLDLAKEGDIVLTLGAGSITHSSYRLVEKLRERTTL